MNDPSHTTEWESDRGGLFRFRQPTWRLVRVATDVSLALSCAVMVWLTASSPPPVARFGNYPDWTVAAAKWADQLATQRLVLISLFSTSALLLIVRACGWRRRDTL